MPLPRPFKIPYTPIFATIGFVLFSYVIIACTESDPSISLNGTWKYTFYEDTETGEILSEPTYIARSVVITFDDNGKKGEFYGQTVTNAIQGKYKIESTGSISFSEITGGQRGEPDWAENFWDALDSAKSFTKTSERLEITFNEGKNKLIFTPEEL